MKHYAINCSSKLIISLNLKCYWPTDLLIHRQNLYVLWSQWCTDRHDARAVNQLTKVRICPYITNEMPVIPTFSSCTIQISPLDNSHFSVASDSTYTCKRGYNCSACQTSYPNRKAKTKLTSQHNWYSQCMPFLPIFTVIILQPFSIKFLDWVCKKTPFKHIFPELPNTDLSQDIKPVSELYGQRLH
jgi:hypothetical protein